MTDNFASPDLEEAKRAYARTLRSALCLSGGGIRSATFNLGVLQGLARHGLLEQFDYLSTVSGGGFIGGWLTAWLHRSGAETVMHELTKQPPSPVEPEPHPINHLRVFSNYLSPRTGLLSADTWTLVSTLLRNLLLNWLVFVPFLMLALLVPRLWMAAVSLAWTAKTLPGAEINPADTAWLRWCLWIGIGGAWLALTYIGIALSAPKRARSSDDIRNDDTANPYKNRETPFLLLCALPGVVSAAGFAAYWARVVALSHLLGHQLQDDYPAGVFIKLALELIAIPWIVTFFAHLTLALVGAARRAPDSTLPAIGQTLLRLILASGLIALAQVVVGALLYAVATQVTYDEHQRLYAALSVPFIISVLGTGCALIAGFTSTLSKDEDLEWWARAGAWFMIAILLWIAMSLLVLFGPSLILDFASWLKGGERDSKSVVSLLTVVGGIVSGVVTLVGGFSGKTPTSGKEERRAGTGGRLLGWLTSLLAPLFFAFLMILLALATNWIMVSPPIAWLSEKCQPETLLNFLFYGKPAWALVPSSHVDFVWRTPPQLVLLTGALLALVGTIMGLLINTNRFSLHYMWRNRIIRAYLGASREPEERNPQPFTNFDTDDNLYMCELRTQPHGITLPVALNPKKALEEEEGEEPAPPPRKLFHVLNLALNLAGGDKLAWQDRKAESFTVSPLHAGSYWLGYRRSLCYGGDDGGISLGTAVAISGAFVSPNMGYMMSSPIVRFLMTLFNVRFGWWLGNPGAAGDNTLWVERLIGAVRHWVGYGKRSGKPFESASPLLSVRPIVAEAFGKTDDKAPYVYLSDGGHFENLGLYEMVLRRCRFIVVCDASTDAGYSFDSLAQSIRQIRVDLGVPIEMRDMSIAPPSQGLRGKYCSVGKIRYSCVDRQGNEELEDADFDGTLIYIKASMIGEEPRDVINYGRGSQTFPQEVIVDQWFSEAQFESYRALGSHIIDRICSGNQGDINDQNKISLAAFERKAREHNQLNFRAFRERADYAALSHQLGREMRDVPPGYRARVKAFLDELIKS